MSLWILLVLLLSHIYLVVLKSLLWWEVLSIQNANKCLPRENQTYIFCWWHSAVGAFLQHRSVCRIKAAQIKAQNFWLPQREAAEKTWKEAAEMNTIPQSVETLSQFKIYGGKKQNKREKRKGRRREKKTWEKRECDQPDAESELRRIVLITHTNTQTLLVGTPVKTIK